MGLFDWLNRLGNEVTTKLDGEEYVELDIVAPYELPMVEQMLADGEVALRQMPTYDAATGLEKVRLLVTREELTRASDLLSQLRGGADHTAE